MNTYFHHRITLSRSMTALAALLVLPGISQCGGTDADGDGWTTTEGDCDDSNSSVYPDAADQCGDGIDANCDGIDSSCGTALDAGGTWDESDFQTVYHVGPGYEFAEPGDVPWESLTASTLVRIHGRETPYLSKWVINAVASPEAPIVIEGVMEGNLIPVIDGNEATTRLELDYWNEDRSIIKVGGSSIPANGGNAAWIYIEDLDIRSARPGYFFTDEQGARKAYADNAASVHIEEGDHIVVRGCSLSDAGNGLFVSSASSDILVQGNHIFGNGNPASAYEHNSYTEALGITFEYNHYGPLCSTCSGNNLKDRSAGTIIRYNWIETASRQIDLVESGDERLLNDPSYRKTYVYGNVLFEDTDSGNSQIVHYGGDGSTTANYRQGDLYLYYNTIVSYRTGNTTIVRLSDAQEHAHITGNIIHAEAGDGALAVQSGEGTATLTGNWLQSGWVDTHDASAGPVEDAGNLTGDEPGFENETLEDFTLNASSSCLNVNTPLDADAESNPVLLQYVKHASAELRAQDGAMDLGAFERSAATLH